MNVDLHPPTRARLTLAHGSRIRSHVGCCRIKNAKDAYESEPQHRGIPAQAYSLQQGVCLSSPVQHARTVRELRSYSFQLILTLGCLSIADVEDSFRADLDEHASDEPLENFLLFLLSCCTGEEKRDALKEKLDRLMDISLRLCSGETSSERPPPAAEQRPRTMPQGAEEKELDSDIAYGAKVPLRSDWHECLQN